MRGWRWEGKGEMRGRRGVNGEGVEVGQRVKVRRGGVITDMPDEGASN